MRTSFEYNGKSSLDMYIHILNDISFPSPEADIEFIEVLGRDGELAIDNGRLKNVTFSIPISIKLPEDITVEEISTVISNWLKNDVGWHPLRFSESPDYEYIAIFYEQFNISETLKNYGKTILSFKLKPYKRRIGILPVEVNNGDTLLNVEKRKSKPLIYIEGIGDITIKNNGIDWLILESVDENISIDSETMSVYKDNIGQFNKMISTLSPMFPLLDSGKNKITWTGNISKLIIDPRWEAIV